MARNWRDTMREASRAQRELAQEPGGDVEQAMQHKFALAGGSVAAQTYREAMARNAGIGGGLHDLDLPERLLAPEERVYEVAVGALSSDTFPLLIVTDRRVLVTKDLPWRRWKILREASAADVSGAELEERLLSGRLRVHLREGKDITLKVSHRERSEQVAALLRHLAAGGAPPR
ncbi:MAG: PH domain-containing protein [Brachybacterium sp.]